jgi:hypothetical protein
MKFEKYYSPNGKTFRGYIIEHKGQYLSTDWKWTPAKTHACRITPEMLGPAAEHAADETSDFDVLKYKIRNLEPLYKLITLCRYREGMSYLEIAEVLGRRPIEIIAMYSDAIGKLKLVKPVRHFTIEEENAIFGMLQWFDKVKHKNPEKLFFRDEVLTVLYDELNYF